MCFCQTELHRSSCSSCSRSSYEFLKLTFSKEIDEKVKNHTLIDNADFYMQQITGNTLKSLLVHRCLKIKIRKN